MANHRLAFQFTPEVLKKVKDYAAAGLNKSQIAAAIGVCRDTMMTHQKKNPELVEALEKGRSDGIAYVAKKLLKAIDSGNVTAMIFYLKSQAEWRENSRLEITGKDGAPLEIETRNKDIDLLMRERFKQILNKEPENDRDESKQQ